LSLNICPAHTTTECLSCRNGIQYVVATPTETAAPSSPCSSKQQRCRTCPGGHEFVVIASPTPKCTTTKKVCPTCPGGYEYIILGTPTGENYTKRPCPTCSGGYEFVIVNNINININLGPTPQSSPISSGAYQTTDFAYSLTYLIRSNSKLVVSTAIPVLADWASQLTWPTGTFQEDYQGSVTGVTSPTQINNLAGLCSTLSLTYRLVPTPDGGTGIDDLTPGSVAPGEVRPDGSVSGTATGSVTATDSLTMGVGNGGSSSTGS
jgi:hypothetical protein